jgi:hypothetical protein
MMAAIAILRELRYGFVKQPVVVELDIGATASGVNMPAMPPLMRAYTRKPTAAAHQRSAHILAMGGSSTPFCTPAVYTLSIFGSQPPELAYHPWRFSWMSLDVKLVRACTQADERVVRLVVWQ